MGTAVNDLEAILVAVVTLVIPGGVPVREAAHLKGF